jgi:guanylate kinase
MSGPGGAGKGTIAKTLVDRDDRLWLSRSWTTREPRPHRAGDDYVFVDREQFMARVEAGGFLEWAEFRGNLYGTPWPEAPEGYDLLLEIDVQGAESVLERDRDALVIFVDAPSAEERAERLRSRGDDEADIAARLAEGERERERALDLGAVFVVNDDLEAAVAEIFDLIERRRG